MSGKSFVGSVLVSIIIIGLAGYFGLPFLYPSLNEENILVQSEYEEYNTPAYIFDNVLNYTKMSDTDLNITIRENSRIAATFTANGLLTVGADFNIRTSYNISLVIKGTGFDRNRTIMVIYYDSTGPLGLTEVKQFSKPIYIYYETGPLPTGTYTIEVYWKSTWDADGTQNSLSVNHNGPQYNYTRSILAQEFRT